MNSIPRRVSLVLGGVALLLAMLTDVGAAPRIDEGPSGRFAVRAGRLYVLSDKLYLENGWMIIEDGRIAKIGSGDLDEDVRVVDLGDASVMPGLVSTHSRIFVGRDREGLGAQYVSADKFNSWADFKGSWEYGVTTARLAPPPNRFVGGIGSTVRFGATPETSIVLQRGSDLLVNFNERGKGEKPDVVIPVPSSPDVPFTPTPPVRPKTRMGRIAALEDVVVKARRQAAQWGGDGKRRGDFDLKLGALAEFLQTGRPLRIDARRSPDIRQAVDAIRALGLGAYVSGADEAMNVIDQLAAVKVPVVLEVENGYSAPTGGFDLVRPWMRDPRTAAELERRGVPVILGGRTDDLLFAAAMAVSGGLDEKSALLAVTERPARLLGVGGRTGSLAVGKDADFIVVNGDPLSSRTHVQETWVVGRRAWSRKSSGEAVVVRAERVYDGTGRVILAGEVLMQDGKIVACGTGVPYPKDARIIDAGPGSVVTPGFIDVHSHLGLGDDTTKGKPETNLAKAFSMARPDFGDVARAGVTTALVAPRYMSSGGSRITAIKTRGEGREDLVTREIAGLKIQLSGGYKESQKRLVDLFKKGDAYFKKWKKYADELKAWEDARSGKKVAKKDGKDEKEGDKKADDQEKKPAPKKDDKDDAISGVWKATLEGGPFEKPFEITMKLLLEGSEVIGTSTNPMDDSEEIACAGSFDGKRLTLTMEVDTPFGQPQLSASLTTPENLSGTVSLGGFIDMDFKAKRVQKGAPTIKIRARGKKKAVAKDAKKPKAPKLDEKLEPFRLLFEGKAGAIVVVGTPSHVRAAAEVFGRYELPVTVLGKGGIDRMHLLPEDVRNKVGVALPKSFYRIEDRKRILIADELDRAGVPIAFQSSGGWSSSQLPRLAAAAVREGLGAEAALRALTFGAAKMFRIEDKVGSLQKGRDADLLIFDGDPFDARTRLKSVFIRGKEVE